MRTSHSHSGLQRILSSYSHGYHEAPNQNTNSSPMPLLSSRVRVWGSWSDDEVAEASASNLEIQSIACASRLESGGVASASFGERVSQQVVNLPPILANFSSNDTPPHTPWSLTLDALRIGIEKTLQSKHVKVQVEGDVDMAGFMGVADLNQVRPGFQQVRIVISGNREDVQKLTQVSRLGSKA
jgi:hypothetical protein